MEDVRPRLATRRFFWGHVSACIGGGLRSAQRPGSVFRTSPGGFLGRHSFAKAGGLVERRESRAAPVTGYVVAVNNRLPEAGPEHVALRRRLALRREPDDAELPRAADRERRARGFAVKTPPPSSSELARAADAASGSSRWRLCRPLEFVISSFLGVPSADFDYGRASRPDRRLAVSTGLSHRTGWSSGAGDEAAMDAGAGRRSLIA
jgi:hypothetical protein